MENKAALIQTEKSAALKNKIIMNRIKEKNKWGKLSFFLSYY